FNDEVLRICEIYEEIIGYRLPDRILEEEINAARSTERDVFDLVRAYSGRINDQGREKVLRAAYHVAESDGNIGDMEQAFFMSLGIAMGMTLRQIDEVLQAVGREGRTDFRRRP
ncbi:MAG TPA: TerB family tellurite resistance protein, partial [Rhodothermales bacterium]|nr:TerB family tellurite resistance protein [Rhodothermales bacterium]